MNPVSILAAMRRKTKVTTAQYTDNEAIDDLNILKDEFQSAILSTISDEKFNWDKWTTDSINLQSEYAIPEVAYNKAGAKLINSVSINYNGETYDNTWALKFVTATEVNPDTLENDWEYYVENQDVESPIYFVGENSIFIAPAPLSDEAGTGRIKLTGIKKISDYTIATTEAEMKFPIDVHTALVYGMCVHAREARADEAWLIQSAEATWIRKRTEAIKSLEFRTISPVTMNYPEESDVVVI